MLLTISFINLFINKISQTKIVFIEKGHSVKDISRTLKSQNIIKSNLLFEIYVKISGVEKKIRSGEFKFSGTKSIHAIVKKLISNNFYYRKIIIPECSTAEEVFLILNNDIFLSGNLSNLPREGTVFPDTYFFQRNDDKSNFIG